MTARVIEVRAVSTAEFSQMQDAINTLLGAQQGWRMRGNWSFVNAKYRQLMERVVTCEDRPWLLPRQSPPVQHNYCPFAYSNYD